MVPKIAFLFLTVGNIFHEAAWIKYFEGYQEYYSLYVHTASGLDANSFFTPTIIQERVQTTWANTMKAQIALLKAALKDTHNEKFVFLSESTIPLSTFEEAYVKLLRHPYSEFTYRKNPHGNRRFGPLSDIYKNSQWIVLNRNHATLMVNDEKYIRLFEHYPHDQEHYPATLLAHNNVLHEVVNNSATLVIWEKKGAFHPHFFKDLDTDPYFIKILKAIDEKVLYARKFSKSCNLARLHPYIPLLY